MYQVPLATWTLLHYTNLQIVYTEFVLFFYLPMHEPRNETDEISAKQRGQPLQRQGSDCEYIIM